MFGSKDYKKYMKMFSEMMQKLELEDILEDANILDQVRYEVLHKIKIL